MTLLEKTSLNKVYFIAEMSANHGGSLANALDIVRAAKASGADCLKIQTYTADTMTIDCQNDYFRIKGGLWDGFCLYDLYKEAFTPWEWQPRIKEECEACGIDFMSTPFDDASADFLESLGAEAYKIASFELVDIPLIRHVAKKGKPVVISCGMGSAGEIREALDEALDSGLPKDKIFLLKCTSEYPADPSVMNLSTIPEMAGRFGVRTGLSDHSMGSAAAVTAAVLGACVIEKHFCLDRSIKNPDSAFSMEPAEFAKMVADVNEAVKIKGTVTYELTGSEKASLMLRRSVFAVKDIKEGEVFTGENIRSIRPGHGLPPKYYGFLLGRPSRKAYKTGQPVLSIELDG